MGETKALSTLVPHIRKCHPGAFIYVTTTTETGQKEAKKRIVDANGFGYLPLDFSWIVKRVVRKLRPSLLILVEGEYWLNLIRAVKQSGGKVGVVSGKLSETSLNRYLAVPFFSGPIFRAIDHFCLQGDLEKERFLKLGIVSERITITGNLKYDIPIEPFSQTEGLKARLNLKEKNRLITFGSAHEGEEALLYSLLSPLLKEEPHLTIAIVPRHPKRFFQRRGSMRHPRVHFIDEIGILPTCYHLSYLAIVGGSFIPGVGGHDIFEPIKMGIPTLYGPYMDQQSSLEMAVRKRGVAKQVSPLELPQVVKDILTRPQLHAEMGERGKLFANRMQGVAFWTWKTLEERIFVEDKSHP